MIVLGALLVLALARPAQSGAAVLVSAGLWMRWGTPALASMAGAQAVLGPAGLVKPAAAAASAWFGAAALVLAASGFGNDPDSGDRRRGAGVITALAVGPAAALVVAGPSLVDGPALRVVASLMGIALALGAAALPWRRAVSAGALVAGLASLGWAALALAQRGSLG